MRFLSLDLIATGPFTDHQFDLSDGNYGLHLIYGPNEAGKSSSLRAISNFLFGFPNQSVDDFNHAYAKLRIGATLCRSDGQKLTAVRRKARSATLRDQDDNHPFEERRIAEFLGNIDRELFQSMFGINHDRLREGGQEIVKGQGRIGELLFSAGSGLAGLHPLLSDLQSQSESLLTRTTRSGQLVATADRFQLIRQEILKADTTLDAWKSLREEFGLLKRRKNELDQLLEKKAGEKERFANYRNAAKSISQWQSQLNECQRLKAFPLLEDGFEQRCHEGLAALKKNEYELVETRRQQQEIEQKLQQLGPTDPIVSQAELIIELRDRKTSYRESFQNLPYQRSELQSIKQHLERLLAELRHDDLQEHDLVVSRDQAIRVQQLVSEKGTLDERLKNQQAQFQQTCCEIEKSRVELESLAVVNDLDRLQSCVKQVQKKLSLEDRFNSLNHEISTRQTSLHDLLQRLPLWKGSIHELEHLALPLAASIETFQAQFGELAKKRSQCQGRLEDQISRQQQIESNLAELKDGGQLPTEADLLNWRRWRSQAWHLIRRDWKLGESIEIDLKQLLVEIGNPDSTPLDEAFSQMIAETDRLADRLRTDAQQIAEQQKLRSDLARCSERIGNLSDQIAQFDQQRQSLWKDWKKVWEPVAVNPLTPEEMKEWMRHVQGMIKDGADLRSLKNERDNIGAELAKVKELAVNLLRELTVEDNKHSSLQELVEKLTDLRDQQLQIYNQHANLSSQLKKLETERQSIQALLNEAHAEHETWQNQWKREMQKLGLETQASLAQANARIALIHELIDARHKQSVLSEQVKTLEFQVDLFESEMSRLREDFSSDLASLSPIDAFEVIWNRFEQARQTELKRNDLSEQQQAFADRILETSNREKEVMIRIEQLKQQANVEQIEELYQANQRSIERSTAEHRLRELEEQIADFSQGKSLEEFIAEVQLDSEQQRPLNQRIEAIELELETDRKERDEIIARMKELEIELKKYDGNSAVAEKNAESQLIATRLEQEFQRWAVLRIAQAVLRRGIEDHRKKYQGPILERAGEIFRRMTLGQFDNLLADFDDRGEPILKGIRAPLHNVNGSKSMNTIGVEGMSDGTCDQLYLSLRLAILESWLTRHEPVPFIVDDILINFDDDRSKATLQVLAELSNKTQVIFFTHHIHLVELAQQLDSDQIIVHQL